ncbi:MAG: hypothetical protein RI580_12985 [Halothece sp. Uz-M2-17]|mgnify:CR=1 FL=1|nr:hypothetical protein [Halothece sp. Uz-M2-17]
MTSQSSDKLPNPDSGVTDSPWEPSWWQWLISALSGTVETEKQTAWLKQEKEKLKKETEQLKKENEQLAVLESKIDGLFSKYGINSKPANPTEEP